MPLRKMKQIKNRRFLLLSTLSVLCGFLLVSTLFGVAECLVRVFDIHPIKLFGENWRPEDDPSPDAPSGESAQPTHIPIHLGAAHFRPHYGPLITPMKKYENGYSYADSEIGNRPRPGRWKNEWIYPDGHSPPPVYYSVDSIGRRVIPGQVIDRERPSLMFLGCSFVYGEGLSDEETLPAQAAKMQNAFNVYNYSFHGWGPNNLLRLVRTKPFGTDISKKPGSVAIYIFIDVHLDRVRDSINLSRAFSGWPDALPYYFLDERGELQTHGMLSQGRPVVELLYQTLAKSQLLRTLGIDLPPTVTQQHLQLMAAVIENLKKALNEKMGGTQFYVAFYPGSQLAKRLIPLLDKKGINSLDYSAVQATAYFAEPEHLPDGHPSAAMNRFFAKQILTDLGIPAK